MKKYCVLIMVLAFGISLVHAQEAQEQLAEVLVLPFANESGKKEYDWLSKNIPNAIVDSMKDKFRFNLMTRDRFEEIVVLSKAKEPVFFRAHTDENEIVKISKVVNADIIIYGKYTYSKTDKIIKVNAFIYHRSRQKTTGNIDMDTPVTSEMFKLVDKVADSVIEHIAVIAKEDAEAAKKAGEKIAQETKKEKAGDDKITLVKREAPIGKSYRLYSGLLIAGGLGYFNDTTKPGGGITAGITNSERSFWHYGLSVSAVYMQAQSSEYNIIDNLLFCPITLQGGINIQSNFYTIFQPFFGLGVSIDSIKIGEETIYFEGEPLREGDTRKWYFNPTALVGLRVPISLFNFFIAPFVEVHFYRGADLSDTQRLGVLLLCGAQVYF
jgi:TolB-like protein